VATDTGKWRDDLTSKTDMDGCMSCGKPTNSHLLLFVWDDEAGVFRAVNNHQQADAFGHVCHGCYTDKDGDHGLILQEYARTVQELCDKYDLTVTRLINDPDDVKDVMDADDWGRL
jgi:hypothetical protein